MLKFLLGCLCLPMSSNAHFSPWIPFISLYHRMLISLQYCLCLRMSSTAVFFYIFRLSFCCFRSRWLSKHFLSHKLIFLSLTFVLSLSLCVFQLANCSINICINDFHNDLFRFWPLLFHWSLISELIYRYILSI